MQLDKTLTAPRSRGLLATVGILVLLALGGLALWLGILEPRARQALVAERGAAVMPFDLERTTHIFEPLPEGGLQQVLADDPRDAAQVALIRSHLQEEAAKFQQGDFDDPAAIHGDAMPGLAELRAGYTQIEVTYAELPDGAQIRYTASDPAMVTALHAWFKAQLSDHGGHVMEHGGL
jgi:hypothetical protein